MHARFYKMTFLGAKSTSDATSKVEEDQALSQLYSTKVRNIIIQPISIFHDVLEGRFFIDNHIKIFIILYFRRLQHFCRDEKITSHPLS